MDAVLLQNWTTVGGGTSSIIVAQDPSSYLDTTDVINLALWVQSSAVVAGGGGVRLFLQTAPVREDGVFTVMANVGLDLTVQVVPVPFATIACANWLRWALANPTATASWSATFRVFASISRPVALDAPTLEYDGPPEVWSNTDPLDLPGVTRDDRRANSRGIPRQVPTTPLIEARRRGQPRSR